MPPTAPAPKFQFSMRTLLLVVTAAALFFGLISLPYWLNQIVAGGVWIAAIGWLVAGIVYARGDQRAFYIGAAVAASSMWTGMGAQFVAGALRLITSPLVAFQIEISDQFGIWVRLLTLAAAACANGWLCIRARRYFQQDSAG